MLIARSKYQKVLPLFAALLFMAFFGLFSRLNASEMSQGSVMQVEVPMGDGTTKTMFFVLPKPEVSPAVPAKVAQSNRKPVVKKPAADKVAKKIAPEQATMATSLQASPIQVAVQTQRAGSQEEESAELAAKPPQAPLMGITAAERNALIEGLSINTQKLKDLLAKQDKKSFANMVKKDEKLFQSVILSFNLIAKFMADQDLKLLQALVAEQRDPELDKKPQEQTVEYYLKFISDFMIDFIRGAESASDSAQFRPFTPRTYDNKSQTIIMLKMASASLMTLLQSAGFVLAMEKLELLDDFLQDAITLFKPPFVPILLQNLPDQDPNFLSRFNAVVDETNRIANMLYLDSYKMKAKAPDELLNLLTMVDTQNYAFILQTRGYRERKTAQDVDYNIELASINVAPQQTYQKAAMLTKDILRDVLANGIVATTIVASEVFLGISAASLQSFFKDDAMTDKVVTALRNTQSMKMAPSKLKSNGATTIRKFLLDKLDPGIKKKLAEKYDYAMQRYRKPRPLSIIKERSGISLAEYKILSLAYEAENALPSAGAKILSSDSILASRYSKAVDILIRVFDQSFASAFIAQKIASTSLQQVTDETIVQLFKLVQKVLNDSRSGLIFQSTRGGAFKGTFDLKARELLTATASNTNFIARLDATSQGVLEMLKTKIGVSSLHATVNLSQPTMSGYQPSSHPQSPGYANYGGYPQQSYPQQSLGGITPATTGPGYNVNFLPPAQGAGNYAQQAGFGNISPQPQGYAQNPY